MEQTVPASEPFKAGLSGGMQTNDSVSYQHKSSFSIYESDFGRGKIIHFNTPIVCSHWQGLQRTAI